MNQLEDVSCSRGFQKELMGFCRRVGDGRQWPRSRLPKMGAPIYGF